MVAEVTRTPEPGSHVVRGLALRSLRLTDFRNYASAQMDLDGGPVVLVGRNGAGKTNILEAVSLLTPGRGLRSAKLTEIDRRGGAAGWAVAASADTAVGPVKLGTARDPGAERRVVRINGAGASAQALAEYMSAVWITPRMNQIFMDGPGSRRRFLDRLVYALDPAHAGRVGAYETALRDRARLLKERGAGADPAWLDALEAQMAERGIAVAAARRDLCDRLAAFGGAGFGPFPGVGVDVSGDVEGWLTDGPALAAEDRFRAALAAGRSADAVAGGATVGPHRSDLKVWHLARDMPADQCSTGEQKALLLALVLAHADLLSSVSGRVPLLLLDEVAAHLDADKREALFDAIRGFGAQAWMTGTDAAVFAPIRNDAQAVRVADAALEPVDL